MKTISSFTIDHTKLQKGIYVSRKDQIENIIITTYDLRMKLPNLEPVMNTAEIHTIEHLGATFLRNHEVYSKKTIYFGPMGCRTGFYLILRDDADSNSILPLVKEMFDFILTYNDTIPGASEIECGNFQDMNLNMAKYESKEYLKILNNPKEENLTYPK